jgi:hypothetical protein
VRVSLKKEKKEYGRLGFVVFEFRIFHSYFAVLYLCVHIRQCGDMISSAPLCLCSTAPASHTHTACIPGPTSMKRFLSAIHFKQTNQKQTLPPLYCTVPHCIALYCTARFQCSTLSYHSCALGSQNSYYHTEIEL